MDDIITNDECTPEFVRWTIGRPCPLREDYDWADPEQTERLLRPVREVGRARRDKRIVEGVAMADRPTEDQPLERIVGFVIEEALAVFGGAEQVVQACRNCPANALAKVNSGELAGCHDMLYLADAEAFHRAIETAVDALGLQNRLEQVFAPARPPWYGFWLASPLNASQIEILLPIMAEVAGQASGAAPGVFEFLLAMQTSLDAQLPLYARLIPSGQVSNGHWKLDSHCRRCKAPRPLRDPQCRVCGTKGDVCAGRTRKLRGRRPYFPLVRQLGAARVASLRDRLMGAKDRAAGR